ncbi:hypothetical protein COP2_045722 [Malus domestica]
MSAPWPCAAAAAAAGGGRPSRLAEKIQLFLKILKITEMKISMSRATFIPMTKANLAGKHLKMATNRRKPLFLGVLDSSPKQL